jgi:hypothetical protein
MPKTLYEKFFQLGFEMTLGKLNIVKKDPPISKYYSHYYFLIKNSPKHQISKPCGLFWKMKNMYMKIYERNLSHSKDNEYIYYQVEGWRPPHDGARS